MKRSVITNCLSLLTTAVALLCAAVPTPAPAAEPASAPSASADQAAELAKKLNNPISSLISVPFQANEDFHMGPTNKGYQFKLNIQPVVPISLNSIRT